MESIDNSHVILGTVAAIAGFFLRVYFPGLKLPTPAAPVPPPAIPATSNVDARLEALEKQFAALIAALSRPSVPAG